MLAGLKESLKWDKTGRIIELGYANCTLWYIRELLAYIKKNVKYWVSL